MGNTTSDFDKPTDKSDIKDLECKDGICRGTLWRDRTVYKKTERVGTTGPECRILTRLRIPAGTRIVFEDKWCGEGRAEEVIPAEHERFSEPKNKWFTHDEDTVSLVDPNFIYKVGKKLRVENFDFELDFSQIGRTGIYFCHEPVVAITYRQV